MNLVPSSLVLVDTCVFVSFFRGRESEPFVRLLKENLCLLSPIVHLELIQGVRAKEEYRLERVLSGLHQYTSGITDYECAARILRRIRGHGITIGIADLLIAAQAINSGASLMTTDKVFERLSAIGLIRMSSY